MPSCPDPTLPPLWAMFWPWQAPLWWLLWLACTALVAYSLRHNYRIYLGLVGSVAASVNRRWLGMLLSSAAIALAFFTLEALAVAPNWVALSSWQQDWMARLGTANCDVSVAVTLAANRGLVYAHTSLWATLILFVVQIPSLFLGMNLRDKARMAALRIARADGQASEAASVG